jgi:tocopherol cyclase
MYPCITFTGCSFRHTPFNNLRMFENINFSLFNPDRSQGWGKKRNYFEGWYFKMVSADGNAAFAVIPGIAIDMQGEGHAFIQILDGKARLAFYHKFELSQFSARKDRFAIQIANNFFSEDSIILDGLELSGEIRFTHKVKWPSHWYSPGIMGPFSFIPFMECYHGIVSMGHYLQGTLAYLGVNIDFEGGKGYTEKDWGRSFPSAYVWMQSNHFENQDVMRFKLSVARIPWVTGEFTGFIAGLFDGKKLIRFTTYNRCSLRYVNITDTEVLVGIDHPSYLLRVRAAKQLGTLLASPIHGFMTGRIEESMTSAITVELYNRNKQLLLKATGIHAGLEIAGKTALIVKNHS